MISFLGVCLAPVGFIGLSSRSSENTSRRMKGRGRMGKEGAAKDLAKKLRKGQVTSREARMEIRRRGLGHEETWKDFAPFVVWGILCFLPVIARGTGIEILSFFAQLPTIEFPAIVIYLSIALFIVIIPLTAWGMYFNFKKGGAVPKTIL